MIEFLQIDINLVAVGVLLLLLLNTTHDAIDLPENHVFHQILVTSMVLLICDTLTWVLDGKMFTGAKVLLMLTNGLFYLFCVYIPYLWLLYVKTRFTDDAGQIKRKRWLYGLPFLIYLILVITTPWNKGLFYIDEQNVYHRGPLHVVQVIATLCYLLYPTFLALKKSFEAKIRSERRECYSIASFVIFPIIGATIQILNYGVPLVCMMIVFSELIIFINVQNRQISLDALTQINNRGQLNRYLNVKIKDIRKNRRLYMLLMDINEFKKINDTFGHETGDRALQDTARLLKEVCGMHGGFLARYGGDEFVIIQECESKDQLEVIKKEIYSRFERFAREENAPYHISLSIGSAEYGSGDIMTVEQLIEAADRKMYQMNMESDQRIRYT